MHAIPKDLPAVRFRHVLPNRQISEQLFAPEKSKVHCHCHFEQTDNNAESLDLPRPTYIVINVAKINSNMVGFNKKMLYC